MRSDGSLRTERGHGHIYLNSLGLGLLTAYLSGGGMNSVVGRAVNDKDNFWFMNNLF